MGIPSSVTARMGCLVTACLASSHPPRLTLLRQEREASRRLAADSFPQLVDLVEDGTLLVLERPPCYQERRHDDFQEPLLLFLLGTSHFSTVSALHVRRLVTTVHPQSVVVELCRSRAGLMNESPSPKAATRPPSNLLSLSGQSFGAALGRSLGMGGQSAMTLRFLLAMVSEKLFSVSGIESGEEFRAACKAAQEVDAQIVLGDRPIEITLRRAWEALNWFSRLKLTALLLRGISSSKMDLSEDSLQALRSDDALSFMFNYLSEEFPALLQPLIYERDRYLAWSLTRSNAVNGSARVVGVVGQGHMRGIVHALKHERETLRFRNLSGVGAKTAEQDAGEQVRKVLARLVVETMLGFCLWLAFDRWCANGDIPTFANLFQAPNM